MHRATLIRAWEIHGNGRCMLKLWGWPAQLHFRWRCRLSYSPLIGELARRRSNLGFKDASKGGIGPSYYWESAASAQSSPACCAPEKGASSDSQKSPAVWRPSSGLIGGGSEVQPCQGSLVTSGLGAITLSLGFSHCHDGGKAPSL